MSAGPSCSTCRSKNSPPKTVSPCEMVPALRDRAGRESAAHFEIVVLARQRGEAQRGHRRAGGPGPALLRRLLIREQVHGFELGRLIPAVVEQADAIAHQAIERAAVRHDTHGPPGRQRVADARPVDEVEISRSGQAFVAERHLELAAPELGEGRGPYVHERVAQFRALFIRGVEPVVDLVLDVLRDGALDPDPSAAPFEGRAFAGQIRIGRAHVAFKQGAPIECEPVAVADAWAVVPDEPVLIRGGGWRGSARGGREDRLEAKRPAWRRRRGGPRRQRGAVLGRRLRDNEQGR